MQRPRPSWILLIALCGLVRAAWAGEAPCGTDIAPAPAAGAPPAAAPDPATAAATASPPADDHIHVTSDSASLGVDGNATLKGNVDVRQGTRHIRGSEIQYNANTRSLKSPGHIDYDDPLLQATGEGGSYSPSAGAQFQGAQFQLHQRAARGAAQQMRLSPTGVVSLSGVSFTTCPARDPAWQIRARDITLDTRNRVGTGRAARVDFMGVPIIYLPWLSFPLGTERKSGFLFPSIGNTSSGGAQLSVPWYWNIAPNADATFEPMFFSRRGADLGGEARFLTDTQHGSIDWNYLPHDSVFHDSRSRVRLLDLAELPGGLRLDMHLENVSDPHYFEDFSQGSESASTAFVDRRATLSYRDDHWRIDATAQQYQTIDYTLPGAYRPYARLPRLVVASDFAAGERLVLRYGFDSEVVNFRHGGNMTTGLTAVDGSPVVTSLATGWRADFMPRAMLDLTGPGYFLRPALAWRATQYQLDELLPGAQRHALSRTLPITSVDAGLQFERENGSHDQRRITLEPRILYLDVPFRSQDQLPVFDTAVPDLNPVQLFRTNRFVGADRVSDANQVSAGITSRLLDAHDGRQFLAATIGQTWYFRTPRVTLPGEPAPTGNRSDFVAQIAMTAYQDWSADLDLQWDPQERRSQRTQVNVQYRPAPDSVLNLAYRYERFAPAPSLLPLAGQGTVAAPAGPVPVPLAQPGALQGFDQLEFSGAWPFRQRWNLFARYVYSLRDGTPLERFAGFEYRACCWRIRLGARRYVNSRQPGASQETGVWLQLELAGLAGVGSASDASLTEAIRGYAPRDPVNIRPQGPLKSTW
ncbi:MAG: LPS assembly protein LptD [Proteobacteria bacterium]|nr:LPS assembly protein LptD [Pseudomonadota bacterium]